MAFAAAAIVLVSCDAITFPEREAGIEGEIVGKGVDVPFARGSATAIWVKEDQASPCGIIFSTDRGAIGERRGDGSIRERPEEDLIVGTHVRVWFDTVLESCPGQSGATVIEILAP